MDIFSFMLANLLNIINIFLVVTISVYGLNALTMTVLYLIHFREKKAPPPQPAAWPRVSVQLPLYNEMYVAARMIDAVCRLDYPRDRLEIQVLDDSTDETTELVRSQVNRYRLIGYDIRLIHRDQRKGYKAGALATGLEATRAEFIAIFDADFVPQPDFLRRVIPHFFTNPRVGMVQTRWGHLNRNTNLITRTQALFLDGNQIIEQVARSRSGLLSNFSGTGGVWRADCIRDSGGWQADTLSEDLDLSYRAQFRGWKMMFLPDLVVPGELPPTLTIFKKQQYRWTFGIAQLLRKHFVKLWTVPGLTIPQRLGGTFQLSTNVAQLMGMLIFLLSVPLALLHPTQPSSLGTLSMASSGPSILFAVSQLFGYSDNIFRKAYRLLHLPLLILVSIGLGASNTWAILNAWSGRKMEFVRTPKFSLNGKSSQEQGLKTSRPGQETTWQNQKTNRQSYKYNGKNYKDDALNYKNNGKSYKNNGQSQSQSPKHHSTISVSTWVELVLSLYNAAGLYLAWQRAPEIIPLAFLGMVSFGFVGLMGLWEGMHSQKKQALDLVEEEQEEETEVELV
jgi:cellulose synthase/poly-beta-1,6-N-acetylglucosamine synthase-like glycosyltransferase